MEHAATSVDSDYLAKAHFEHKEDAWQPYWIILTAHRFGSGEEVTVEMDYNEWQDLAPVQYVIKLELSQHQPRLPRAVSDGGTSTPAVPSGHIEWIDGRNWVIVTAHRVGTKEPVTVQVTIGQWIALKPNRFAVLHALDAWRGRKEFKWSGTL